LFKNDPTQINACNAFLSHIRIPPDPAAVSPNGHVEAYAAQRLADVGTSGFWSRITDRQKLFIAQYLAGAIAVEDRMITERFNSRTMANMEVALERACLLLSAGSEKHRARRIIASK